MNCRHSCILTTALLFIPLSCNQGGKEVHVKKSAGANAAAHETGRYDVNYKTESECKANHATWDSEEGECYIMCISPNTFDKITAKCTQAETSEPGHELGRFDLKYKTKDQCKANQGLWDGEEGECYVMCLPPNRFDKANSKCIKVAADPVTGHEPGRYDLNFKTESECMTNSGLWDSEESECYIICLPPMTFDKKNQMCMN